VTIAAGRAAGFLGAAIFLVTLWMPGLALADDPVVQVRTEVVLASNQGSTVDPPDLERMKKVFSQKGFAFTSYQRLSGEKIAIHKSKPAEIALPNQRSATIRLDDIKRGTASVEVIISQLPSNVVISSTVLTLGREGSLFQHAGDYNGGQLILVISPDDKVKPRRAVIPMSWHAEAPLPRPEMQSCPESACCP
jgi:hypothetical protein